MIRRWCELITGIVVVVFALWTTVFSKWILAIAGALLVIHSFGCDNCLRESKKRGRN